MNVNEWHSKKIRVVPPHVQGKKIILPFQANCFIVRNNTATITAYAAVKQPPREVIEDVLSWKYFYDVKADPQQFKGFTTLGEKFDEIYVTCGEAADDDNGGYVVIYYCYDPKVDATKWFS